MCDREKKKREGKKDKKNYQSKILFGFLSLEKGSGTYEQT